MGEFDYEDFGSDIYLLVFLFLNIVIMLNFIIAILVATFQRYEEKSNGYYYQMILSIIPSMEYSEKYGAIVCATQPLDFVMLLIYFPVVFVPEESKAVFNTLISTILYLPIALSLTILFTITNALITPLVLFIHTGRIIRSIPF